MIACMTVYLLLLIFYLLGRLEKFKGSPVMVVSGFFRKLLKKLQKRPGYRERQTGETLQTLYPGKERQEVTEEFHLAKIRLVLIVIVTANTVALLAEISMKNEGVIKEGGYLKRSSYGKGDREELLFAQVAGIAEEMELQVPVMERKYNQDEARELLEAASEKLEALILADNPSLDEVRGKLKLVSSVPEMPVTVEWQLPSWNVIDREGNLQAEEVPEEGILVELRAMLQYEEESYLYTMYANVLPPVLSEEEAALGGIAEAMEQNNEESKTDEFVKLPEEWNGAKIEWNEKRSSIVTVILVLGTAAAVMLYIGKDQELKKQMGKRNRQMLIDYPEIVSKMTLLLGAGMPVKRVWGKVALDYQELKKESNCIRYAYEEMLLTYYEMQSGISEIQAYDRFGKRCKVQQYLKFSALLTQNLKKGAKGLAQMLAVESDLAFESRKNLAKKIGEEAGTKLLIPMFIMLAVVLIIIMVPAFMSFQM